MTKYICDVLDAVSIVVCMLVVVGSGMYVVRGVIQALRDPDWRWALAVVSMCVL
jgi:hypothetical protein